MGDSARRFATTGWLYLVLTVVGLGGALAVTYGYGLGVAQAGATLLPTLAPLYLSWAAFRQGRAEAGLAEVADQLARAVRGQWEAEVRMRRVNDPYPLPVSWRSAPAELAEEWSVQVAMAASWPGARRAEESGGTDPPAGADVLAGAGEEIVEVFTRRVPTRRLVVLGEPGAGKSMLLARLLLRLLDDRAPGGPVPVLLPMASWAPDERDLYGWMAARLATDYRGLGDPAPAGHGQVSRAQALLQDRLVLPVLDGLDELPPGVRAAALVQVNEQLPPGQGVVLAGRSAEYRAVAEPSAGLPVKLAGAAAIELTALDDGVVADYLRRAAGGRQTASAGRWDPVVALLGSDAPVARVLRTPLMVFLARTVYNPRPGERPEGLPDPAELCDTDRLPTAEAVRTHLYDAFVPAAYRTHPRVPCPWPAPQAEAALAYLARRLLHRRHGGGVDLTWWDLPRAGPRRGLHLAVCAVNGLLTGLGVLAICLLLNGVYPGDFTWAPTAPQALALVLGIAAGSVLTERLSHAVPPAGVRRRAWEWRSLLLGGPAGLLTWPIAGPLTGFAVGAACGLVVAHPLGPPAAEPAAEIRWSWNLRGLMVGPACALAALPALGPGSGLAFGAVAGLAFGVTEGWRAGSADLATAVGPTALLHRDRRVFGRLVLVNAATGTAVGAALGGLLALDADGSRLGTTAAVLLGGADGLALGLSIGLVAAWSHASWGLFTLTRGFLALRGELPRALMDFLADAHAQRGVLRQVGSAYQFRHLELQQHLAARPPGTRATRAG